METELFNWYRNEKDNKAWGNVYTGSRGTDPKKGMFDAKTFKYRVWADAPEEEIDGKRVVATERCRMRAACFSVDTYKNGFAEEQIGEVAEEYSQEGIDRIAAWLDEQYAGFLKSLE